MYEVSIYRHGRCTTNNSQSYTKLRLALQFTPPAKRVPFFVYSWSHDCLLTDVFLCPAFPFIFLCRFGYVCSITWHERIRHYVVEQLPGGRVQLFGQPRVFEDLHMFVEHFQ